MVLTAKQAQNLLDTYSNALSALQQSIENNQGQYQYVPPSGGFGAAKSTQNELRSQIIGELLNTLKAIANKEKGFEPSDAIAPHLPQNEQLNNVTAREAYLDYLLDLKYEQDKKNFVSDTIEHFVWSIAKEHRELLAGEKGNLSFLAAMQQAKPASRLEIDNAANLLIKVGRRHAVRAKARRETEENAATLLTKVGKGHAVRAKARRETEEAQKQKDQKENGAQKTSESSSDATFYLNCLASIAAIGGAAICIAALVTGQPLAVVVVSLALTAIGFMAYRPDYGTNTGNEQKEEMTPAPN
ncbi:MAG: hypothetical protein P1U32_03925 [Legionellaceae bacterium]|nr:hypothetical protein [Legionellaceae bacterium]